MMASVKRFIFTKGIKFYYFIFKSLRKFYMTIDFVTKFIIGYSLVNGWKHDENLSKARFDKSGNLTKVWLRGSSNPTGSKN